MVILKVVHFLSYCIIQHASLKVLRDVDAWNITFIGDRAAAYKTRDLGE